MVDEILVSASAKDEIVKVLGMEHAHVCVAYIFALTE